MTSDPAAKGLAKDLKVAGAGPVHCHFSLPPPPLLTMCGSERCRSILGTSNKMRDITAHDSVKQVQHDGVLKGHTDINTPHKQSLKLLNTSLLHQGFGAFEFS